MGIPLVYCASSLSLAVLEFFVNIPPNMRRVGKLPVLEAIGIEVPDDAIEAVDETGHAPNFELLAFQAIGDAWFHAGQSLGLIVASAVVRRENNVLLNPRHSRMAEVKVVVREPFIYDDRLDV